MGRKEGRKEVCSRVWLRACLIPLLDTSQPRGNDKAKTSLKVEAKDREGSIIAHQNNIIWRMHPISVVTEH